MKAFIILPILSCFVAASSILAAPPEIETSKPKDGVYLTYGMHSIVLELKENRFRYWFTSDRLPAKGEELDYPLEGSFTVDGDTIVLEHKEFIPLESNWTFKTVDGVVTMWRLDAMELLADDKNEPELYNLGRKNFLPIGWGSILVPTKKSAEEAWNSPQHATLTEEEHDALIEKNERE
ncbi:MAG: hypothetical protein ACSHX9_05670 [Luteolibacter sp.]